MTENKNPSGQAEDAHSTSPGPALRKRAEELARNHIAQMPENLETRSPAEDRQVLHELRVYQIELEMQNEELRRTQGELEASRSRYFDLYDLAPVGYLTLSDHGLILEANLTATKLFGVVRKQLVNQSVTHFIVREDQDIYYRHQKQLFETGAPQACELRMRRTDAAHFWARLEATTAQDADGAIVCRAVVSDITERKQIEEVQWFLVQCGYQNSGEDFFQALARYLAQNLDMDYVCIDQLLGDGLVAQTMAIYSTGKFEDNVAYALKDTPCGDVLGKTICCFPKDVHHLFPRDAVLQKMRAESYVGTTLWSFDGKPIGLIAVIGRKPLVNTHRAEMVLKMVAVRAAGELERKRAEEALRRTAAELALSNQELEQFTNVASHDLKEPLRIVGGFMHLLKNQYQDKLDAKANEYIAFAADAATRMQALIDDLLAYARVGSIKVVESANVTAAVDQAIENLWASIDESGAVITRDPLPVVPINSVELTQVFQNLIGNAIKFRAAGRRPEIHIGVQRVMNEKCGSDSHWLFSIRDNGIGIEPKFAERIFMVFQRLHTRQEYPGSGVGLAICKKIVERHGGRIWVESQPGNGSTFFFCIPDN